MTSHILKALIYALAGMLLGEALVWFAVTTWNEISTWWLLIACTLPLGAFLVVYAAASTMVPNRRAFRVILLVLSAVLGGLTNYTAWIITARTWNADLIPAEHQDFLFQLLHPSVMPVFVELTGSSSPALDTGWLQYLVMGAVTGGGVFWWITRPERPAPAPAAS